MSIATVITDGYGSFGSVNFLPTLGYGDGYGAGVKAGDLSRREWLEMAKRERMHRDDEEMVRVLEAVLPLVMAQVQEETRIEL